MLDVFFARGFWDEGITQQEREPGRPAAGIHQGSLLKGNTEGLTIICRIIEVYTRIFAPDCGYGLSRRRRQPGGVVLSARQ